MLVSGGQLVAAILAFVSHEFGATWHSNIGLAVLGIVTWHVIFQRRWVKSAARKRLSHPEPLLVVSNTVLAATFTTTTMSGFPVWFGDADGLVLHVHNFSGLAFVLLVFAHVGFNSRRLIAKFRRRPRGAPPPASRSTGLAPKN